MFEERNLIVESVEFKKFVEENSYLLTKNADKENVNELYENITKVKKEKIISKVTFVDNVPYKIVFHFIKNPDYLLLIKAYDQNSPKCVKEIKISHEKFLQILGKINNQKLIILYNHLYLIYMY